LYVGYDSAGQHVAAAAGVPLISIFTGYPCERMLARWRPNTPRSSVIAVDETNRAQALSLARTAIAEAAAEA
jgi:ADP-heptose:LPS heptosyltransferase